MKKEIVIKIPDKLYEYIVKGKDLSEEQNDEMALAIAEGIPLPKGHGKLIDEDVLEFTCNADDCGMLTGCNHCQYHIVTEHEIDNAPTIIEADRGSESE